MPACSSNSCSLLCSWKRRRNLVASRTFFSSVWMSEPPGAAAFAAAFGLLVPIKRLFSLSRSECRNALEQIHQMTRAHAHTAMEISRKVISNLHHLVEQIGAQADPRRQQFFVELRPDPGSRETAHHPPVRIQAALFEHKDVLQR